MAVNTCGALETDSQGRELKRHGTALFPAACYEDDLAEDPVPWHWHDELEAAVVTEGRCTVSVGSESCTLAQGDGVFINTGVLHGAWGGPGCRLHSIVFHPRLVGGSVDSIFWQGYLHPLLSDAARPLVRFSRDAAWNQEALTSIEAAWQACAGERPGYEFAAREALSKLVLLLSGHRPASPGGPSEKDLRDGGRMKAMLQYIQDHCGENLTVEDIARSVSISESECLRCFRSTIGVTPIRYVRQLRVQRAAELLAATDRRISDIGALCGFQEMSYFAKTFRALRGCTPSEYRRRHRHRLSE